MKIDRLYEKAHGCLAGVAIGDAMGMPTTLYDSEKIKQKFEYVEDFLPPPSEHPIHKGMKAAEVTDDTKITLILADSIIENGQVSSEKFAKKLVNWAIKNDLLDTEYFGPSTSRALKKIKNGVPIQEAGKWGTTNGAAMRIAPVGILNAGKVDDAVNDAERASLPTHGTNIAIAGACAVACAIAEGMKSESRVESVERAAIKGARIGWRKGFPMPSAPIDKRIELALKLTREAENHEEIVKHLCNYIGRGVESNESIPTAFAIIHVCNGDPMKAIITTTNMGGDADTISSIAGGICGSIKGIEAFPSRYVRRVEKVNGLHLREIAMKLVEIKESV